MGYTSKETELYVSIISVLIARMIMKARVMKVADTPLTNV